jgi:hypothetical protein
MDLYHLQSGQFIEDSIPTVGFNMRKVTKGVCIKLLSLIFEMFQSNKRSLLSNSLLLLNYGILVANLDSAPCGKDTVEELMPLCTYPINA